MSDHTPRTRTDLAILDGRLGRGTKLPATRRSEAFFGVSRNTLAEVYERLLNEGYVVIRQGSGTYVADKVADYDGIGAMAGPRPLVLRHACRRRCPHFS